MNLAHWLAAQRGRQVALAAHLRIKPPQVAAWLSRKRPVPLEHCPFIQAFTDGAVTCEELRPDAAEYFALIRAQTAGREPSAHSAEVASAPAAAVTSGRYTGPDRRDLTRPSPYAGSDIDRRAPAGEGR